MAGGADPRPEHRREHRPSLLPLRRGLQEMALLPIPPDELLAEIFLRLPTSADLVRASAACISFRRLIAHRSFLRQYRRLHAPPLLGLFDDDRIFLPTIRPHSSAPAASNFALDFSFLPPPADCWIIQDTRDGRILLDSYPRDKTVFMEIVVCDPLHRRYVLLPPIPDNQRASVEDPFPVKSRRYCHTFLIPSSDEEEKEAIAMKETSFRMVFMMQCKFKLFTFVFSSSTGQWRAVPSQSLSGLFPGLLRPIVLRLSNSRQYAYGCFYWIANLNREIKILVLDVRRMEFSIVNPPDESKSAYTHDIIMVEAGGGRPGMFVRQYGTHDIIYYSIRRNHDGSFSQWQCEKTISLGSRCSFVGSMERYLLLYLPGTSSLEPGCFTLDIQTFQLEKACHVRHPDLYKLHPYVNFPPLLLSLPTISSGVDSEAVEMLEQGRAACSSA